MSSVAVNGTPTHSCGMSVHSVAIWDQTVLPDPSKHTLP